MERRHKWEPGERVLAVCTGTWHYGVGVNIKPNTWYACRGGELVEVRI